METKKEVGSVEVIPTKKEITGRKTVGKLAMGHEINRDRQATMEIKTNLKPGSYGGELKGDTWKSSNGAIKVRLAAEKSQPELLVASEAYVDDDGVFRLIFRVHKDMLADEILTITLEHNNELIAESDIIVRSKLTTPHAPSKRMREDDDDDDYKPSHDAQQATRTRIVKRSGSKPPACKRQRVEDKMGEPAYVTRSMARSAQPPPAEEAPSFHAPLDMPPARELTQTEVGCFEKSACTADTMMFGWMMFD